MIVCVHACTCVYVQESVCDCAVCMLCVYEYVRACVCVHVHVQVCVCLCDNLSWFDKFVTIQFYWVLPQLFTIIDSVSTIRVLGLSKIFEV